MGPDKEPIIGEYYIELSDGKRTKISGIQIFDFEDLKEKKHVFKNLNNLSFSIDFSNKYHINKKKFKKWLMGRGISRNDADYLCFSIGYCKGAISYRRIYISQLFNSKLIFADIIKEIWLHEGETE